MATSIPRNLNSRGIKSRTCFFFVAIIGASLLVVELWNEIYECHVRLEGSLELLEKEVGVQYAGFFVDSRRGIIYVGLVKPIREQMASIINVMRLSSKVKIVFYEAELTLRQLEEAADKITARLDELNQAEVR